MPCPVVALEREVVLHISATQPGKGYGFRATDDTLTEHFCATTANGDAWSWGCNKMGLWWMDTAVIFYSVAIGIMARG